MLGFFKLTVYEPLYNGLILLIDVLPWLSAGMAVILFTIIIKLILFPLSKKAIKTQVEMKKIEPEMNAIKATVKDRQEQAMKIMALYRTHKINPLSGILTLLIQIPIIISLFAVFRYGLPEIRTDLLYPFVANPGTPDMIFLGIDIAQKSIVLALLAGISQFYQIRLSIPALKIDKTKERTMKDDFAHSMNLQMRYMMPVIVAIGAYTVSGAIALYWITSNVFAIIQEVLVRKQLKKTHELDSALAKTQ